MIDDAMLHEAFVENVRRRRKELRLTQAQLAAKLDVSRPYIAQIEAGDHTPSLDLVERIARALNCPALSLLMQTEDAVP